MFALTSCNSCEDSFKLLIFLDKKAIEAVQSELSAVKNDIPVLLSSKIIDNIDLKQIEIISMDNGEPVVSDIKNINYKTIKISISHEDEYAIAFSLLEK